MVLGDLSCHILIALTVFGGGQTRHPQWRIVSKSGDVTRICFSPDGKQLCYGCRGEGTIGTGGGGWIVVHSFPRIDRVAAQRPGSLGGTVDGGVVPDGYFDQTIYSPDGGSIATIERFSRILLLESTNLQPISIINDVPKPIVRLEFHANGKQLALLCFPGNPAFPPYPPRPKVLPTAKLAVVDLDTRTVVATRNMPPFTSQIAYADGVDEIVAGGRTTFSRWNSGDLARRGEFQVPYQNCIDLEVLHDGMQFVTICQRGAVLVDLPNAVPIRSFELHDKRELSIAVSSNGRVLAAACDPWRWGKPIVVLWDVRTGKELGRLDAGWRAEHLAFHPSGRYLAATSYANAMAVRDEIAIWDLSWLEAAHTTVDSPVLPGMD